jgi:ABC-type transporter Mla MlaB component
MKARPKKPSARSAAVKKPAVARGRSVSASKRPAPVAKANKAATASRSSSMRPAKGAAAPVATVGTDCTIEHAPGLHKELLKMLAERACVTLDVSAVKRCDTAGLQVLAAFVRERREAGQPFELKGATEAFVGPATLLGLGTLFGLDSQAARS